MLLNKNAKSGISRDRGRGKRSAVTFKSPTEMVRTRLFSEDAPLPLVIEPVAKELDLTRWLPDNLDWLREKLNLHGGLLFRGFDMPGEAAFSKLIGNLPSKPLKYMESSTPRQNVAGNIYTSTEYPPEESIALHNELSSAATFPLLVWFFCAIKPGRNGQTPIGDARSLFKRIDPEIRETFMKKGWSLVRNYADTPGLAIDWRTAFKTDSREAVEAYCEANRIEFEWRKDGSLRTLQKRPVTVTHPLTGEVSWFNHMSFWHPANLCANVREEMIRQFGEDGLPYHTFYGDMTPIPDEAANHIRDCYLAEKVIFDWEQGDLMMIDNIATLHGRQPYEGDRKILVAMNEPYTRTDLD